MDFKQRFQGRMNAVDKRGIKHTLFDTRQPLAARTHANRYSNIAIQPPLLTHQPIRRRSTCLDLPTPQKDFFSTQASSLASLQPEAKGVGECYLDQMLEKHKNLLQIIDRRASYKAT